MTRRSARAAAALFALAWATTTQASETPKPVDAAKTAETVKPGEEQGLGLTGPNTPTILKAARDHPYVLPEKTDCATLAQQVADLDAVLGADLDVPPPPKGHGGPDVMAGVRGVLPYGGVVRLFTRAGHKERALVQAALAGWERRGFLKGVAHGMGCPPAPAPAVAVAAPASPAPSR